VKEGLIMVKVKMDSQGRILIPVGQRKSLCLRAGAEFDVAVENGLLILKPVFAEPLGVDGSRRKWGGEAFLGAGEATFGLKCLKGSNE
jgi:bifunctional DNA-binding transcriptional regulator/antitoxin component of YhaV-PrlF toxin-antitoxin module